MHDVPCLWHPTRAGMHTSAPEHGRRYAKLSLGEQRQRSRKMRKTLDPIWTDEVMAFAGVLGQLICEPLKVRQHSHMHIPHAASDLLRPWPGTHDCMGARCWS